MAKIKINSNEIKIFKDDLVGNKNLKAKNSGKSNRAFALDKGKIRTTS